MIRVVMLGRLGNNLFQYAFGRALAMRHEVELCLDGSWFNAETWRSVSAIGRLPGFARGDTTLVRRSSLAARALKKLTHRHYWEFSGKPVIRERTDDHSFNAALLEAPADCVIMGYFQTPLYFRGLESLLRDELRTDGLGLERGHEQLAQRLAQKGSVAVHVRRTDYVNHPILAECTLGYYQRSIEDLRRSVGAHHFYLFSDDPDWCEREMAGGDVEIVRGGGNHQPLVDLHLMSLANHHIIANSSFSWWGAWLGKKPDQQVVLPDQWFRSGIRAPIEEKWLGKC